LPGPNTPDTPPVVLKADKRTTIPCTGILVGIKHNLTVVQVPDPEFWALQLNPFALTAAREDQNLDRHEGVLKRTPTKSRTNEPLLRL
jgi:hypothetical protein